MLGVQPPLPEPLATAILRNRPAFKQESQLLSRTALCRSESVAAVQAQCTSFVLPYPVRNSDRADAALPCDLANTLPTAILCLPDYRSPESHGILHLVPPSLWRKLS